jgi:hypothetical protein
LTEREKKRVNKEGSSAEERFRVTENWRVDEVDGKRKVFELELELRVTNEEEKFKEPGRIYDKQSNEPRVLLHLARGEQTEGRTTHSSTSTSMKEKKQWKTEKIKKAAREDQAEQREGTEGERER